MKDQSAGLSTTVYRLNLAAVADSFSGTVSAGLPEGSSWYPASEHDQPPMSRELAAYGLCSGILVFGIVYIMTCALEKANIVILITQISSILTFLPGGLFLKTRFGPLKIAGAVLGTGGILLLSCT